MNPTVKAILLSERSGILSAIAAREATISDLLVQLNAIETDVRRLRHRLIDLEAFLVGQRVDLPDGGPGSVTALASPRPGGGAAEPHGLPACRPLADFVRHRTGRPRVLAVAASRRHADV